MTLSITITLTVVVDVVPSGKVTVTGISNSPASVPFGNLDGSSTVIVGCGVLSVG